MTKFTESPEPKAQAGLSCSDLLAIPSSEEKRIGFAHDRDLENGKEENNDCNYSFPFVNSGNEKLFKMQTGIAGVRLLRTGGWASFLALQKVCLKKTGGALRGEQKQQGSIWKVLLSGEPRKSSGAMQDIQGEIKASKADSEGEHEMVVRLEKIETRSRCSIRNQRKASQANMGEVEAGRSFKTGNHNSDFGMLRSRISEAHGKPLEVRHVVEQPRKGLAHRPYSSAFVIRLNRIGSTARGFPLFKYSTAFCV
jgi:hypothetical protein